MTRLRYSTTCSKKTPAMPRIWYYKGIALSHLHRHLEAVRSFDKTLEIDPDCTRAWSAKADACLALQKPMEALDSFDRALETGTR